MIGFILRKLGIIRKPHDLEEGDYYMARLLDTDGRKNYSDVIKHRSFAFEGPDGVGKTELLKRVRHILEATHGLSVHVTKEPTTMPPKFISGRHAAMWFVADREKHLHILNQSLPKNTDVLLFDRCWLSTLVYQGTALCPNYHIHDEWGIDYPRTLFLITRNLASCEKSIEARGETIPLNYRDIWRSYNRLQGEALPVNHPHKYTVHHIDGDSNLDDNAILITEDIVWRVRHGVGRAGNDRD